MRIRGYGRHDLDRCRSLWADLVERHRDIYDDQSIGGDSAGMEFDEHLAKVGPDSIWVAEVGGEVVGFTSLIEKDQEAEIEPVVVSPGHRGEGVGTGLVDFAVDRARELGLLYVFVRPVARNREAVSFFHRRGFKTVGHIQLFQWLGESLPDKWKDGLDIFGERFMY